MTEQTKELVTKVDVQPDLAGLVAFEAEIDRAIVKVNQLDNAIKRVNELRPTSRYAPPVNNPGATAAAAGLSAGLGANLVSRGALAPLVRKASENVAKNAVTTAATGVNLAIEDMRGRLAGGGGGLIRHTGNNWTGGSAGGLAKMGDFRQNPFNRFNFEGADWSAPAERAKKTAKAAKTPGEGFKMPDMMAGAASAYALSVGLGAVADSMDRVQSAEAQLARLPQTIGSSKDAYIQLTQAASDVRSNGDAFISTYTNMATATEKLGLSQEQTTKATQGLVSALQLGGGSKVAIDNALYQMGQAFSSNRFAGDEFRSFMEAIGTMAPTVAKSFGTDVAGLRKMSEDGKLTAEVMVKAFEKMADSNIDLLKKQGWTWGQVTTVMKNDWDSFLATATKNGEWAHLMSWIASNVTPVFRDAQKKVAEFWNTTTDASKASILIGILGTIGAAFAALAVPVLAAVWPFLAVGAAVFLLYELFQEFQHWLDGSSKTIFDNLFGSFDEFEKRYPAIVKGLRALIGATNTAADAVNSAAGAGNAGGENNPAGGGDNENVFYSAGKAQLKKLFNPFGLLGNSVELFGDFGDMTGNDMNPLTGIEKFLSLFMGDDKQSETRATGLTPPSMKGAQTNISNTNSGNTTIQVATPEDAATVANAREQSFIDKMGNTFDNMAEGGGYL
ncbi:tape measure protein [Yokenella regensburgei]|uniref:tape measure protein n=1 Tax=Yokenella regensburgei TaxID=158877 RepID=UPI003EDB4FF1